MLPVTTLTWLNPHGLPALYTIFLSQGNSSNSWSTCIQGAKQSQYILLMHGYVHIWKCLITFVYRNWLVIMSWYCSGCWAWTHFFLNSYECNFVGRVVRRILNCTLVWMRFLFFFPFFSWFFAVFYILHATMIYDYVSNYGSFTYFKYSHLYIGRLVLLVCFFEYVGFELWHSLMFIKHIIISGGLLCSLYGFRNMFFIKLK